MRGMVTVACLVGTLGLATVIGAQTASSDHEKKAGTSKHSMTVTGCLREATGAEGEFLLTKAPASTTTSGAESATTYRLVGGGKVNLKEHVGHKVEVTGEMAGEHGASQSSSEKPAASSQTASSEPKITVTSLKHISASCEPASK
jgi:hypothetical protein